MNHGIIFLKKHWFLVCIISIIFLAAILRFYSYPDRWGLAYDQAHDAIIAQYAISHAQLPLLGPFSSAGAFQTGGEWYWILMLGSIFVPFLPNGPWIFLTLAQLIFVVGMIFLGKKLVGKSFGLLAGLLAAISPTLISQSINMSNQAPLPITSLCAIFGAVYYLRNKNWQSLFFLGFFISLGAAIHLQGVALVVLLIVTLIFSGFPSVSSLIGVFIGLILPWVPIFFIDAQHGFFNAKSMLQYYLHDQYKISFNALGRRWSTYIGVFWPTSWANLIGAQKIIGYVLYVGSICVFIFSIITKKVTKEWLVLFISFIGMMLMLRYIRTPLFDSYLMFVSPFILLFTAYFIYFIFTKQKIIGTIFLLIVIIFTLQKDVINISNASNEMVKKVTSWTNMLHKTYPNKKFALYDYKYRTSTFSLPLIMYLQKEGLLDDNGYKIGFGDPTEKEDPIFDQRFSAISKERVDFTLSNINSSNAAQLKEYGWSPINPSYIYNSTEKWYLNK